MNYLVCLIALLASASLDENVKGQALSPCPQVRMACAGDCCGPKFEFTVHVAESQPATKLTYKWSISAGVITIGQGTPSIAVDSTEFAGHSTTATVEIDGLSPNCQRLWSHTQTICEPPLSTYRFFDRYGDLALKAEKALLNKFALQLNEFADERGFIYVYNGQRRRAVRAKKYLVTKHKIAAERIMIVEGGRRPEPTIELYLVPLNMIPPEPYPPPAAKPSAQGRP